MACALAFAPGCDSECINVVEVVPVDAETGEAIDAEIVYARSIYSPRLPYDGGVSDVGHHQVWVRAPGYRQQRDEIIVTTGTDGCFVREHMVELQPL